MKGLLLKDWYMMVRYCKAWVVILVVMIGASAFSDNPFLFLMYPVMLAGAVIVSLPMIVVFFLLQKYIIGGISVGAVKG